MDFGTFQKRAAGTDQNPSPAPSLTPGQKPEPTRSEVIPLLGLVGEVGSLLSEYKKLLRDGEIHRRFKDEVAEELGDILWYVATVATKYGLSLDEIAQQNQDPKSRLPREFEYSFEHQNIDGTERLVLIDRLDPEHRRVGDPLTDNAYDDDGYRYHDVFHLTLAARFGWSPVYRKLLRKCSHVKLANRTPASTDDSEDGGRAQVVDEAIALMAYGYAAAHNMFESATSVDWQLLRTIKRMTEDIEVKDRTTKEWNDAILRAFEIWRQLRAHRGGIVRGDLRRGTIEFIPLA
jgi:NTP pyrophosphatase (non-canonical NTP hydrolase)